MKFSLPLLLSLAMSHAVLAGTISSSPTPLPVNEDDIANYAEAYDNEKWWVGNGSDASTVKGQIFYTGDNATRLKAVSYHLAPDSSGGGEIAPIKKFIVRVGFYNNGSFDEIHQEEFTLTETIQKNQFITWKFDRSILLDPNTYYAIDVGLRSSTSEWRTGLPYLSYSANVYEPSGYSCFYTSGTNGIGNDDMTEIMTRDRIFHLDMGDDITAGSDIQELNASQVMINSGQRVTLNWKVRPPYDKVTIDQWVGNVSSSTNSQGVGSTTVSPTRTTTYRLTSDRGGYLQSQEITIYVNVTPSNPRINEISARPGREDLRDEDEDVEDWIELYNPGPQPVDLGSYHLSDEDLNLTKWSFPSLVMLPDSYLVVFASGKDRTHPNREIHTNFQLADGGEYLALSRRNSNGSATVVSQFAPTYPKQAFNLSYGYSSNNTTIGYLSPKTPGAPNGVSRPGVAQDTSFSFKRGFYTQPFNLEITTLTPNAQIRYTIDGSVPTATTGSVYNGPIRIASTTVVRAAAFASNVFTNDIDTQTYLFLNDIRTQNADGSAPPHWPTDRVNGQRFDYGMDPDVTGTVSAQAMVTALSAIPSVSLTISQEDLNGPNGINTNAIQKGSRWEREASLELLHPGDTDADTQSECGLRIRGNFSRGANNAKHSFRLFFRDRYQDGPLKFPLFGSDGAESFDKVDFRTAQNYSWVAEDSEENRLNNTFLRDVFGRDLQLKMGQPATRSSYYHLYLNGIYWGLYMTQERAEANFGKSYLGGKSKDYDTIKAGGSRADIGKTTEATDGDISYSSDWRKLWEMGRIQRTTPTMARFMAMQGLNPDGIRDPALPVLVDVDNLIDYFLAIGYVGNYDGPITRWWGASNNWFSVRNRESDDHGFQFFVHDCEHTLGNGQYWGLNDRINIADNRGAITNARERYNLNNPYFTHKDLSDKTTEYRLRFADRAHKVLFNDGLLEKDNTMALLGKRQAIVDQVIIAESARWGDSRRPDEPYTRTDWLAAVAKLHEIIDTRREVFMGHLRKGKLYPSLAAPSYRQHGGEIASGSRLSVTVPRDGTHLYYKIGSGDSDPSEWRDGLDPRLTGGAVDSSASMVTIPSGSGTTTISLPDRIDGPVWVKSRTYNSTNGEWSALNEAFFTTVTPAQSGDLVISEINYHPADPSPTELAVNPDLGDDDFEFIEIMNISSKTIDLSGVAFTLVQVGDDLDGIEFTFPNGASIAPGQRLAIVRDEGAFGIRYPGALVSGVYDSKLSNGGEMITLVSATGEIIDQFTYDDQEPWPIEADGAGQTLERRNPSNSGDANNPTSWALSSGNGGTPGANGQVAFSGTPHSDLDQDGYPALVEYAQGSSDQVFSNGGHLRVSEVVVGGSTFPAITYRENPSAMNVSLQIEVSSNLTSPNWAPAGNGLIFMETTNLPGGAVEHTYRLNRTSTNEPRYFYRLKATQQ